VNDFDAGAVMQQKTKSLQKCLWNAHFFDVSCRDVASRRRASQRTHARHFRRERAASAEFTTLKKFCGLCLPQAC
jgi:hypothetical protein